MGLIYDYLCWIFVYFYALYWLLFFFHPLPRKRVLILGFWLCLDERNTFLICLIHFIRIEILKSEFSPNGEVKMMMKRKYRSFFFSKGNYFLSTNSG